MVGSRPEKGADYGGSAMKMGRAFQMAVLLGCLAAGAGWMSPAVAGGNLQIQVRVDGETDQEAAGVSVSGSLPLGEHGRLVMGVGGSGISVRGASATRYRQSSSIQQIVVMDGGEASMTLGRQVILPLRQGIWTPAGWVWQSGWVWRDVGSGFAVRPRVAGDRVTLDLTVVDDTQGEGIHGQGDRMRLATTVSGAFGEWMSLGGTRQDQGGDRQSGLSADGGRVNAARQVWIRVDPLP